MKNKFTGNVKEGKLTLDEQELFLFSLYEHENKKVVLTIEAKKNKRTTPQNKLYWQHLNWLEKEYGQAKEELHDFFKAKFLFDKSGKIPVVRSTKNLSTVEFTEYLRKVEQFLNELSIYLPFEDDCP